MTTPNPPQLTALNLNDSRPFAVAGVDLCGPLYVKNVFSSADENGVFKWWVALYTCAASRGVVLCDTGLSRSYCVE